MRARIRPWAFVPVFLYGTGVLLAGGASPRAADSDSPPPKSWSLRLEGPADAARLAREVVRTFMIDEEWNARVAETRERFKTWTEEHHEDAGRFLNDRIVAIALAASGGKIEKLKEGAIWVALYGEFRQPPPSLVTEFVKQNLQSLNRLLQEFTWERASAYVKARQWRKDFEEERKARETRNRPHPSKNTSEIP